MKQIFTTLGLFALFSGNLYGQLNFDGIDDGISLTTQSLPMQDVARTVEARIRTTNNSMGGAIVTFGNPSIVNGRFALYESGGNLNFVAEYNDYNTNMRIDDGLWHHVAATYDGGFLKLYLDGVLVGSQMKYLDTKFLEFSIGFRGASRPSEFFRGDIEEVRIWNVVRTPAQINDYKNDRLTLPQSGLVSYYKFNQGIPFGNNLSETTLVDQLSLNPGALNNFALTGTTSNWTGNTTILSVKDSKEISGLKIFPNPVSSQISITGLKNKENFVIYDTTGRVIKAGTISSNDKIDVSALDAGLYYIKINNDKLKFIKQ